MPGDEVQRLLDDGLRHGGTDAGTDYDGDLADTELQCAFCGRTQSVVRTLVTGRGTCICHDCVVLADSVLDHADGRRSTSSPAVLRRSADGGRCHFCGAPTRSAAAAPARVMVTSRHGGTICRECLALCRQIVDVERLTSTGPGR